MAYLNVTPPPDLAMFLAASRTDRSTELRKKFAKKIHKKSEGNIQRKKVHILNKRNEEVYKVNHAHTETLKNLQSPTCKGY